MGVIVIIDMLIKISPDSEYSKRFKNEIIDNLDSNDLKIHFFTVFSFYQTKFDQTSNSIVTKATDSI